MVINPEPETSILWLRDISLVPDESACGAANGRNPANTLKTSVRPGALLKYFEAVLRIKSISCSIATGSRLCSFNGVSVVPTTSLSCHGTAKSTQPSSVLGIIKASSDGMNDLSSTK